MIVRRQGKTEILETTESVGAKAALEQLNKRLETLLAERNARLADVRQELHEREAIYRFIAENINEIIAVFQADGKRDYISDSAVRVLGNIPPEDFSGVHPNDLPRVNASFAKVVAGEEDTLTFRHRHNDGSWRWLEFTGKPAKFDGMPYVIGVGRDVTERVKLEEQLHHSQKMEALGRFAGGVSHDFNNLLTAIYGYAELVAGEVPNNSAAYDNVREIQRATDRAQGVTRQLLTFSRREVLQPQAIDLGQVVNRMERMLRLLLREDVQFAIRRCRWPLVVLVDPTQIEQLVVNLVSNARDATPANGTIEVICDEVVQDGAKSAVAEFVPPGTYARLRVTDSGSGMPAEVVDKAFDPFFTTKPPGVGTGLGLSTVFGIVRQAKGHVWIDSEEGAGTTVVVLLPLAAGTAELPRRVPRSGRADRLEGKAVMVVEDEDMVRSFVEQALHRHGAKVTALADPVVAIERLSDPETRVDVLVSDVIMPGLSGPQLAERAQRLRPGLPVVLMSGYTADESLLRDAQQGWPLLEKPFRPDELVELIRRAIPPASSSTPSKSRRRRANRSTAGPE
jgi:PAS domain S-box-containing protein